MSPNQEAAGSERANELGREFDQSFAKAPDTTIIQSENLISIRIGVHPYAIRITEISGIFLDKRIKKVPSPFQELLGIAGFRGVIVPVYDLRLLLGYTGASVPRWLVLAAGESVGLAFDQFEGHLRIPRKSIDLQGHSQKDGQPIGEIAQSEAGARPIAGIPAILNLIRTRGKQSIQHKGR